MDKVSKIPGLISVDLKNIFTKIMVAEFSSLFCLGFGENVFWWGQAGGRRQEAEGRRQEAGGRRQEAEGRRQKAGGRRQKAGGRRQEVNISPHLPYCLLTRRCTKSV
jgi:hypothetical protein